MRSLNGSTARQLPQEGNGGAEQVSLVVGQLLCDRPFEPCVADRAFVGEPLPAGLGEFDPHPSPVAVVGRAGDQAEAFEFADGGGDRLRADLRRGREFRRCCAAAVGEVDEDVELARGKRLVCVELSPQRAQGFPQGVGEGCFDGTVTLFEKSSSAAYLRKAATGHRRAVHFQAAASVAVTSCQTAKRSAISVRHSGAESLCRLGRKCGEMPEKADRNRCACPGDVKRFIACSRCLVG